jgi:hypothetical protein
MSASELLKTLENETALKRELEKKLYLVREEIKDYESRIARCYSTLMEIQGQIYMLNGEAPEPELVPQFKRQDSDIERCPKNWTIYTAEEYSIRGGFVLEEMWLESREFRDFRQRIANVDQTIAHCIYEARRIQNPKIYALYDITRAEMEREFKGEPEFQFEQILFFPLSYKDQFLEICANGFDNRIVKSLNSQVEFNSLGNGTHFVTTLGDSLMHVKEGVIVTAVLTGRYSKGRTGLKRPPENPNFANKLYDSVVNSEEWPQVFAIFDSRQAYPLYHIKLNSTLKR